MYYLAFHIPVLLATAVGGGGERGGEMEGEDWRGWWGVEGVPGQTVHRMVCLHLAILEWKRVVLSLVAEYC